MSARNNGVSGRIPVAVIFAPTATGKTALLYELFSEMGGRFFLNGRAEVISADSMQVYRGMDIGTAKPSAAVLSAVPHHLIDIVTPDIQFSVADFVDAADALCAGIYGSGRMPVVAGGTGFYIKCFLSGLPDTPAASPETRAALRRRLEAEGADVLYRELAAADPESAAAIHPNDTYRILRALEIFLVSGRRRSGCGRAPALRRDRYEFLFIVLEPSRELLSGRICGRVDGMFDAGLEDEVASLVGAGFNADSPGMKAIGYREWFMSSDRDEIRRLIKRDSVRYAKKQFTYIKDMPGSAVIPFDGMGEGTERAAELLRKFYFSHFCY